MDTSTCATVASVDLPTRCFVNGQVIRPTQLTKIRIRVRDEVVIVSRPGNTRSGSASTAKSIGSVVALVALAVLAPYAGGAIAGMVGIGASTTATLSSFLGGVALADGCARTSDFLRTR